MLATGIIDPAKVTRSALQNAASIAALFLTTEAVVADKPEKAAPPPGWRPRHGRHGLLVLATAVQQHASGPGHNCPGPLCDLDSRSPHRSEA